MNALVTPEISIGSLNIRMDSEGRYCLNDLHKAAGGQNKHRPSLWLANDQAKELIAELDQNLTEGGIPPMDYSKAGIPALEQNQAVKVIHGGNKQGTFVCKELVYAYAMWISAKFHLQVIRTFDAVVSQQNIRPLMITEHVKDNFRRQIALTEQLSGDKAVLQYKLKTRTEQYEERIHGLEQYIAEQEPLIQELQAIREQNPLTIDQAARELEIRPAQRLEKWLWDQGWFYTEIIRGHKPDVHYSKDAYRKGWVFSKTEIVSDLHWKTVLYITPRGLATIAKLLLERPLD